jgi:ankyrin repeat protein
MIRLLKSLLTAILCLSFAATALIAQSPARVDFGRDVQPILKEHCYECHGSSQQMRGLRLDRRRDALPNRVGANNARIVPGNSDGSLLYRRLSAKEAGTQMPPAGPLRPEEIGIIKRWIDQGAEWPDALSGEIVTQQPDPVVARFMQTLRNADRAGFKRLVQENPKSVNAKGQAGWTSLMYAALYGDAETVGLLLEKGANANSQNDAGGTALMYAIEDVRKIQLLLDHGADPNLQSGDGRTALAIAVGRPGSAAILKLLLDKGAKGPIAGNQAVAARDVSMLQLLLDRNLVSKPLPVGRSLRERCMACFDLLLPRAEPGELNAALTEAVRAGNLQITRSLLEKGAKPEVTILQVAAMSAETLPAEVIQTLISRGADIHFKTSAGISILDFAKRQGNLVLVDELIRAGAKDETPAPEKISSRPAESTIAAIDKALPALQRADVAFLQRAGCVSCHNNSLTSMTRAAARPKGIHIDETVARGQLQKISAFLDENRERALENLGIPGGVDTVSYILLGLAAENYPNDSITEVWSRYLKNNQSPDGRWRCAADRPPIESSDFEVTAATIRAVRKYGPKSQRGDYDQAVKRAVHWLENAEPKSTEDHAFKILGLIWGGADQAAIDKTARALLNLQRPDGGWAQLPNLDSDAYATGQALFTLREARRIAAADRAYQSGIQFLMNTQLADGSWYVRTRALPVQPYFDSDFPHGRDQFISAAATNWATMALTTAVPEHR